MTKKSSSQNRGTRGIWFWTAVGIVAAGVLGAGVGIIAVKATSTSGEAGVSAAPTPASSTGPDTSAANGGCRVPGGDITEVPADLTWTASKGATWPASPSLGPTSVKDGFPVCFSHSPIGAALAATQVLFAQVDHAPAESGEFYTVESPGKAIALKDVQGPSKLVESMQQTGMQLVGFRIDEYTQDRALVQLVMSAPNGGTNYVGMPAPMVWVDGDWRLRVLDNGTTGPAVPVNAGQFTLWSPGG